MLHKGTLVARELQVISHRFLNIRFRFTKAGKTYLEKRQDCPFQCIPPRWYLTTAEASALQQSQAARFWEPLTYPVVKRDLCNG